MSIQPKVIRVGTALVVGLIGPPAFMYTFNSLVGPTMADLLIMLMVETSGFVLAALIWQAPIKETILTFLIYFILMFALLFEIGLRVGVYDWP